jgi:hypothetical protein
METDKYNVIVEDWQSIVNKPVYSSDGKRILELFVLYSQNILALPLGQ